MIHFVVMLAASWAVGQASAAAKVRADVAAAFRAATPDDAYRLIRHAASLARADRAAPVASARALVRASSLSGVLGYVSAADEAASTAVELLEKYAPGSPELAEAETRMGKVSESREDFVEELYWSKRALAIQRLHPRDRGIEYTLDNLAWAAFGLGRNLPAEKYLSAALKRADRSTSHFPDLLSHLAHVYQAEGKLKIALGLERRAYEIRRRREPGSINLAASFSNIARIYFDMGRFRESLTMFRQALRLRKRLQPFSPNYGASCSEVARTLIRLGRYRESIPYGVEGTDHEIGAILGWRKLGASSRQLLSEYDDYMVTLVPAFIRSNQPGRALETIERFRGVVFETAVAAQFQRSISSADLERRRRGIAEHIAALYRRLNGSASSSRDDETVSEIESARAQERRIESEESTDDPALPSRTIPLSTAHAIQHALDPGTLLLEFALCDDHAFVLAVTRDTLRSVELPASPAALQRQIALYCANLRAGYPVGQLGKRLYDILIAPVRRDVDRCSRILVSPQATIGCVPFAALVVKSGPAPTYRGQLRSISECVSVTALAKLRQRRFRQHHGTIEVLAIGDPEYPPGGLPPLRGMAATLGAIASVRSSVLLLGHNATISNLVRFAPRARIVHLACHGKAIPFDPLGSWLALTPSDGDDGYLRADDILSRLHLTADLAVLCGCDTAAGTTTKAEGIDGLTRSTLAAGAASVVSSLWDADVEASNTMMGSFYSQLRAGRTKEVALQLAQAETRKHFPNPYYWSGFILSGDYR